MKRTRKWIVLVMALFLMAAVGVPQVGAVGATTLQLQMAVDQKDVVLNGTPAAWDTAPALADNQVYVPLKAMGDALGFSVKWNGDLHVVEMKVPKLTVRFDLVHQEVAINSVKAPLASIGMINADNKLMVKLHWIADMIGAKADYHLENGTIDVIYTKLPDDLIADGNENSRPVAKFTTAKTIYKLGEPVKFIDLSYDPDAEGIAKYDWTGKEDAYFTSGTKEITLKVTDGNGHESKAYSRTIWIQPETFASQLEYKLQYTPVGTAFQTDWSELWGNFNDLPIVKRETAADSSRKLIVSDSPETITEQGILYQELVNGKARLYADHVNGMSDKVQFVIMVRNTSLTKPVTIKTTNKGEVYPSIYANVIGHEASVDFMLHDKVDNDTLTIPPDQGFTYVRMPDFYPGQGVNCFYDVETDGEVEFSFVAMDNSISTPMPSLLGFMKHLPFVGNVRGTFPTSDVTWNMDMKDLKTPSRVVVGDGKEDPFVKGYDNERKQEVLNEGNYGMMYTMNIAHPPKMDVLLVARGGPFKGPFKINDEFTMVPKSGVLSAFTSVQVLARTTGTEDTLKIEFTPPAGSAFPVDVIFYPLRDLK